MNCKKLITLIITNVFFAIHSPAKIWMPAIFSDGMVLQQQSECKLWGTATPGSIVKVTTSWSNLKQYATAAQDGKWSIKVKTPAATNTPQTFNVTEESSPLPTSPGGGEDLNSLADRNSGKQTKVQNKSKISSPRGKATGRRAMLGNGREGASGAGVALGFSVLIGEVWLCAGQSNMEMPMKGFPSQPIEGGPMDILHSGDAQLRLFTAKRTSRVAPIDTITGSWSEATPETVRNFSATAYYFGRELRRMLNIPVGLIVTAWGGSSCESWMDREHVKQFVHAGSPYQIPNTPADIKSPNRTPTVLYNGMLHPIIGYNIKGAIWYQGEDNVPRYQDYAQQMQTMVSLWRDQWGVGEFPFYYCQIAPYEYSIIGWTANSALLREQQLMAEQQIPNCGMAVLMDAGIEKGIHPPKKDLAGERLALLALVKTYGTKGVTAESARFKSVEFKDSVAYIKFENDKMNVYSNDYDFASKCFEVAGADSIFHPAVMDLYQRKTIKVWSPAVKNPIAVRYAFRNWVKGDLFCDGLPLSSWRSDNWPISEDAVKKAKEYDR